MRTCPTCNTKHPTVRVTVLDTWSWNANDTTPRENIAREWLAQQVPAFRRAFPGRRVTGKLYARDVRAGNGTHAVVIGVIAIREPWHTPEDR